MTWNDFEIAIIAALTPLENAGDIKALKGYAGELTDEAAFKKLLVQFPAILVLITGESEEIECILDEGNGYGIKTIYTDIMIAGKNLRPDQYARKGVYNLIEDVKDKLKNQTINLAIDPILYRGSEILIAEATIVVAVSHFEITRRYA